MNHEILFDRDAANGSDCVLLAAMSGSPQEIKDKLIDMAAQIDEPHGKPIQGIASQYKLVSHVITPVWKGKQF